jgi:hypothetical protein
MKKLQKIALLCTMVMMVSIVPAFAIDQSTSDNPVKKIQNKFQYKHQQGINDDQGNSASAVNQQTQNQNQNQQNCAEDCTGDQVKDQKKIQEHLNAQDGTCDGTQNGAK